jgi:hypothetical protein
MTDRRNKMLEQLQKANSSEAEQKNDQTGDRKDLHRHVRLFSPNFTV